MASSITSTFKDVVMRKHRTYVILNSIQDLRKCKGLNFALTKILDSHYMASSMTNAFQDVVMQTTPHTRHPELDSGS
ncbi:hypothetical protein [Vibrio breoganii]|nr:hypothetical protein [Vibrio breoganii]